MNPNGYIAEINSISVELKRLELKTKQLREQKRVAQGRLYDYMYQNDLKEYGGITAKSIAPKPKKNTKTKEEKKDDAIALLRENGIPNPDSFYEEFLKTQKPTDASNTKVTQYYR